jgi:hypothetical protein
MFLLNCETSWLVYADWLEDHDLDATHIREPGTVNAWHYESVDNSVGGYDFRYGLENVGTEHFYCDNEMNFLHENYIGDGLLIIHVGGLCSSR